jgi:predicted transcriptional regulator
MNLALPLLPKGKNMPNSERTTDKITLAAEIVSAYVRFNSVPAGELADLIHEVHTCLLKLGTETAVIEPEPARAAVSIRKSIAPEYLVCLDDGKKFKSLKRHLNTLDMTPDQYRQKWNLPGDYPMVAPAYAAARSALAKKSGLGQLRKG